MKNKIRIGEFILKYRKEHRLTQGEFGELLGVSTQAVSKWEREICYPDIFLIPAISDLIGISIDELMGKECSFCAYKSSACQKNRQVIDEHKKAPLVKGAVTEGD